MITVVEPEKRYSDKIGDILWGEIADWLPQEAKENPSPMAQSALKLNALDGDEGDWGAICLGYMNANYLRALKYFGIDNQYFLDAKYKDIYTGYECYGIIPIAILTNNPERYRDLDHPGPNMDLALDVEFAKSMVFKDGINISRIGKLLMGSGHTNGCLATDGSCEATPAKVKLSNGDWLYVNFWMWYNK